MSAQSDLQSKRYFLQDNELQVTETPTFAAVTLQHANTIRVQLNATEAAGDITLNIGGQTTTVNVADNAEAGGTHQNTHDLCGFPWRILQRQHGELFRVWRLQPSGLCLLQPAPRKSALIHLNQRQ